MDVIKPMIGSKLKQKDREIERLQEEINDLKEKLASQVVSG